MASCAVYWGTEMSLAEDLTALRLNGVTVADFHPDGKLAHVEMGPPPVPFVAEEEEQRGVMVLPGDRGGPAEAPIRAPAKPRDLMRDLILADLAPPPDLTEDDLPGEPDDEDDIPESTETTYPTEARDDQGDGGVPRPGVEQAASWRGQSA